MGSRMQKKQVGVAPFAVTNAPLYQLSYAGPPAEYTIVPKSGQRTQYLAPNLAPVHKHFHSTSGSTHSPCGQ